MIPKVTYPNNRCEIFGYWQDCRDPIFIEACNPQEKERRLASLRCEMSLGWRFEARCPGTARSKLGFRRQPSRQRNHAGFTL